MSNTNFQDDTFSSRIRNRSLGFGEHSLHHNESKESNAIKEITGSKVKLPRNS